MSDRALGTMVTYGFPEITLDGELAIATKIGATVLEILPHWSALPDASILRDRVRSNGLQIHSAHGCWGQRTIWAGRVDLGSTDAVVRRESLADLKRCVDWLEEAGGHHLVVHPGGFSDRAETLTRRAALMRTLTELADHAGERGIRICVENMPPGVYPGGSMAELFDIVEELGHSAVWLALDTGHANLISSAEQETLAACTRLATTHVHDNNGRKDSHEPPGHGTVHWARWAAALDEIGYTGPIMLECIQRLRADLSLFRPEPLRALARFECLETSK